MTEQPPEEQLEHWRSELARVLKARSDLTWPSLIDWAEEAEEFALKACTKSGRARLANLDTLLKEAEAKATRLARELEETRNAKLAAADQRVTTMEKLAAAWQKEAEQSRNRLAEQAYSDDAIEFLIWSALERPLPEVDVVAVLRTLRNCRALAGEAIHLASDTVKDTKKRVTALHAPVRHMGQTWCGECSVRRSTGPRTEEWVAFIPHPCPTIEAITERT